MTWMAMVTSHDRRCWKLLQWVMNLVLNGLRSVHYAMPEVQVAYSVFSAIQLLLPTCKTHCQAEQDFFPMQVNYHSIKIIKSTYPCYKRGWKWWLCVQTPVYHLSTKESQ
jgi:hypothetical protein